MHRATVLICMLGASKYAAAQIGRSDHKYFTCTSMLITAFIMFFRACSIQSLLDSICMLGASKYAQRNRFDTHARRIEVCTEHPFLDSNIISICRCEHAHNSQCILFRACSSQPFLGND